jgi:hypothetical protein
MGKLVGNARANNPYRVRPDAAYDMGGPMACSRCGDPDHNVRTCEFEDEGDADECDSDCLYELSGNYCPECHRGD